MGEEELSTDRDGLEDEDYLNAVDRCQPQTLGQVMSAALEGSPVILHEMSGGWSERNAIAIGRFSVG